MCKTNFTIAAPKSLFFILNKSNFMHNIPFIHGGIDNLSRDSRSISRDVSVISIIYSKIGNSPQTKYKQISTVNASTLKTYK